MLNTLAIVDWTHLIHDIEASAIFGLLAILLVGLGYLVFCLMERRIHVSEELSKGNIAVGIVVGSYLLGVIHIIAAVIVPDNLDMTKWGTVGENILLSSLFSIVGIVLMGLAYEVFDLITPKLAFDTNLKKGNLAMGLVMGVFLLGISHIIALIVG